MAANLTEIKTFLSSFKAEMEENGLNIWPTGKNERFVLDSGFTNDDIDEIIRTLEPRHYESGPKSEDNDSRPDGEVWIFGREYEGYDLYIKLKSTKSLQISAECLSAHEAEFPLKQPMRNTK